MTPHSACAKLQSAKLRFEQEVTIVIEITSPDGNRFRIVRAVTDLMLAAGESSDRIALYRHVAAHEAPERLFDLSAHFAPVSFTRDGVPFDPS